jgi:hypothetical protein
MVPNLNVSATEADMLLASISGRAPLPPGLPAPSIRSIPLDEAAGRESIFAIAFPILRDGQIWQGCTHVPMESELARESIEFANSPGHPRILK